MEKEFAKDGIAVRWVQTNSSSNALQFLNAGSIDFGSTAGSAALVARINGNPIKSVYVYSRPEWTALVTTKDSKINKIEDLKGKKVAMVRGTDPHIFLVRALFSAGLTDKDITPVLVQQHADGGNRVENCGFGRNLIGQGQHGSIGIAEGRWRVTGGAASHPRRRAQANVLLAWVNKRR